MNQASHGGVTLCQEPTPSGASRPASTQSAREPARASLLTAEQAAKEVYGVSERTFHGMRAKGLVPPAVELGPRLLRWHRGELEAAIAALPRVTEAKPVPAQLLRGKIERMKAGASAVRK